MTTIPGDITSELTAGGKQRFNKEPHKFDLNDAALAENGHLRVVQAVDAVQGEVLDADT